MTSSHFWFIHLCLELQPISNQKMGLVGFVTILQQLLARKLRK